MSTELLRRIAARASTLDERLAGAVEADGGAASETLIDARLDAWRNLVAAGDDERFTRRLRWDGIDPARARAALGNVRLPADTPLPSWCETVAEVIAAARAGDDGGHDDAAAGEPIPFAPLLEPARQVARARLQLRLGAACERWLSLLSPSARRSLERALLERLHFISARCLLAELDALRTSRADGTGVFDELVGSLLARGLVPLFERYPVLARLWATAIDQWVAASAELLARLDEDRACVGDVFRLGEPLRVESVSAALSDPHDGGRTVFILGFAGGGAVVYKPRPLALEVAFTRLLAWCAARLPSAPRAPRVVDRGAYGWVERVEQRPCGDVADLERFYRRAGALVALAHLLDATDLHWENVIACGDDPILVDLEALLHPLPPIEATAGAAAEAAALARLRRSALSTNLLPCWSAVDERGRAYDNSGLGGSEGALVPLRQWVDVNRDGMALVAAEEPIPRKANRVVRDGAPVSAGDHVELVDEGFSATYRLFVGERDALLAADGPLAAFAGCAARYVFRPTAQYAARQVHALTPELLGDGVDRSLAFEALGRSHTSAAERPTSWPLFGAERRALATLDVPRFVVPTSQTALVADGVTLPDYFATPSFAAMRAKLSSASEAELAFERRIVRAALTSPDAITSVTSSATRLPAPAGDADARALVAGAAAIASALAARAIRAADGSVTWIKQRAVADERRYATEPAGPWLGDGAAGVLVFLAALERCGGVDADIADLRDGVRRYLEAQLASAPRRRRLPALGYLVGRTSIAHALFRAGTLLADSSLIGEALALAHTLDVGDAARDEWLDVAGGAAGAILALAPLLSAGDDAHVRALIIACGERLLGQRRPSAPGPRAWVTVGGRMLTGLSHGAAGIALALAKAAVVTGRDDFAAAAIEGVRYENALFDVAAGNWPDLRPNVDTPFCFAWCAGAGGIALARTAMAELLDEPAFRDDAERAITALRRSAAPPLAHLCCGVFGRAEVLREVGRRLGRPALVVEADALVAGEQESARARGGYLVQAGPLGAALNPALFVGWSGVGHSLLRAAAPALVPSVLLPT